MAKLQDIGLSEGEEEVYLSLLKSSPASVMKLSKETGRHRTHIYDTIEKLKEKGLVSESITDNKRSYTAANPESILELLREKEERAISIVEELKTLQKQEKEIKVETFKGTAGLKAVLRDILKEKKDYVGYGEGARFGKILPIFYDQFRNQSEKLKIELKLILKSGVKVPKREGLHVRYLDYLSPSTTFVYADKVLTIIWEPFPTAIRITEKQVAQSYKSYFELMWKIAKS